LWSGSVSGCTRFPGRLTTFPILYIAATYVNSYIGRVLIYIQGRYVITSKSSYKISSMTTLKEHLSKLGRKGGLARSKNMTPEQRREAARKAVGARWAKEKKKNQ